MPIPVISTTQSVLGFRQGEDWTFQPYASGDPTAWKVQHLPPGVTMDSITGAISGPATQPGVFNFAMRATSDALTTPTAQVITINAHNVGVGSASMAKILFPGQSSAIPHYLGPSGMILQDSAGVKVLILSMGADGDAYTYNAGVMNPGGLPHQIYVTDPDNSQITAGNFLFAVLAAVSATGLDIAVAIDPAESSFVDYPPFVGHFLIGLVTLTQGTAGASGNTTITLFHYGTNFSIIASSGYSYPQLAGNVTQDPVTGLVSPGAAAPGFSGGGPGVFAVTAFAPDGTRFFATVAASHTAANIMTALATAAATVTGQFTWSPSGTTGTLTCVTAGSCAAPVLNAIATDSTVVVTTVGRDAGYAVDATWSDPVVFTLGVERGVANASSSAIEMVINLVTREARLSMPADAAPATTAVATPSSSAASGDLVPLLWAKYRDDLWFLVSFEKAGVSVDMNLSDLNFSLKELDPDGVLIKSTQWQKVGIGSSSAFYVFAKLEGDSLLGALSGYAADDGTKFIALSEFQWVEQRPGLIPATIRGSSRTFGTEIAADINV